MIEPDQKNLKKFEINQAGLSALEYELDKIKCNLV